MTLEEDVDKGAASPSIRIASGSTHPLQGEEQKDSMTREEQTRLLNGAGRRSNTAPRPHTFAGQSRFNDLISERRSADLLSPDAPAASSSWGQPDTRERFLKVGLDSEPRGSSIPPRLSTLRAVSHSGLPSVGTGNEGHPSSQISVEDEAGVQAWRSGAVGSSPLDRTIDAIGMGRYQYAVLILSGLGWAADNMWLQGIAIILPRVQDEWTIGDQWIGLVSSCTFAGMMVGALAWGSYADTFGRKNAFNITLLVTSIFGLLSSFSPSFPLLCLCLFLLGTGVGGSMPTDGTIFLEALPKRNHYLLTALSVFFAAGSVVSSVMGLILVPANSCGGAKVCDVAENKGWRWLLASLGFFTLLFVIARLVFFSLFESPKFLVSAGRHEEARSVLQRIADFNGNPKKVKLSDVNDQEDDARGNTNAKSGPRGTFSRWKPKSWIGRESQRSSMDWQEGSEERQGLIGGEESGAYSGSSRTELNRESVPSSTFGSTWIPQSWKPSLAEARKRYSELFSPHWAKTTILVWSIWTIFTLAYTMVNIFLPKYLQERSGQSHQKEVDMNFEERRQKMEAVMQEFLFYSLASLPGSLLGAYLIETSLGRIKSMAMSTALLALALLTFAFTTTPLAVVASSCSISLFASVSYAVIYSYSPEVFETSLRGTASGTASALSRFAGILAPLLAGFLMSIHPNLPLFLGFALFAITVYLELSLPYETKADIATQHTSPPA